MSKTSHHIRVDLAWHLAAAELCLSQARWFERRGDLENAEDAHADTAWHLQKASECRALIARLASGLVPTAAT